jgi:hypothetical protein
MHYSSCSVWPGAVSIKIISGHITLNLCFLSCVMCGSRSAFWCVQGVKCGNTIFLAQVGLVQFS